MDKSLETVKENLFELGFFKYCEDQKGAVEDVFKEYRGDGRIRWTEKMRSRLFVITDVDNVGGMADFVNKELVPIFQKRGISIKAKSHTEKLWFDN